MLPGIKRLAPFEWEVPVGYVEGMHVPGRFFLSDELAETLEEGAVKQARECGYDAGDRKKFPGDA